MNKGPGAMNRIYRLVWRDSLGAYVAVAETASGRGKKSSRVAGAMLAAALAAGSAHADVAATALPTGGRVSAGQATISQSATRMDIQQTTGRVSLNWTSFNIGSQAQVNFNQPDANSFALNRVLSSDPSAIFGRLTANGQVMLVNPNGIVFGAGSKVDVGGLVASTLNISDADFMAGRLKFSREGATGSILNQGQITAADGGYVALLAPEVRNQGVIAARLGTVALAAGDAVALDISGNGLLNVRVDPATVDTLVENRNLVKADGGQVILSAGAANRLIEQAIAGGEAASTQLVMENGHARLVAAGGTVAAAGGQVRLDGSQVDVSGSVDVGGSQAGSIKIGADFLSQSGSLNANATVGKGGSIAIDAGTAIQTASALLSADGAQGGGTVRLDGAHTGDLAAADHGRIYSSASFSARGTGVGAVGGSIKLSADSVQLRAATLDASGAGAGGQVLVGGGFRGQDASIANAVETGVNGSTVLRADGGTSGNGIGNGGQVVVWSDQTTVFGGQVTARGGSQSGNGGEAEVSGKGSLVFGGRVDLSAAKGTNGHLALDPHDIVIDDQASAIVSLSLDDPNPDNTHHANDFAKSVEVLTNGNVVVTAPRTSIGGVAQAGAVYLFNSRNGSLLNQIYGSHENDQVGSGGVRVLANDNYLVLSPLWNPNSASVTYYTADYLGGYRFSKTTGTGAIAGAITWQNGTPTGSTGATGTGGAAASATVNGSSVVGTGNSLVGSNATNDRVGDVATTSVTVLSDGNLAIATPMWNAGRGAVTWLSASTGQLGDGSAGGTISSANSLVGSTPLRDTALVQTTNGHNYYVTGVNTAGPTSVWKVTQQVDPQTIGAGDLVGQSVVALAGGNFAVVSSNWSNGGTAYVGAVTWGGSGNRTGAVAAGNSLVGSHAFDFVGSGGVSLVGTPASSGALAPNYVVVSPYWGTNGSFFNTVSQGAVTWVDGITGHVNTTSGTGAMVSAVNSLVGGSGDMLGGASNGASEFTYKQDNSSTRYVDSTRSVASGRGTKILSNGNLVVADNSWSSNTGSVTLIQGDTGTFGNGTTAAVGAVSASNSLVGAGSNDYIGADGILELSNHNYVVTSRSWGGSKGAVTLVSGSNGQIFGESNGVYGATVASRNSVTGSTSSDRVASGGVVGVGTQDSTTHLWNNYLVLSPYWGSTSTYNLDARGAVTWGSGSAGVQGAVSSANSLVGDHAGDFVGSYVSGRGRSASNWNGWNDGTQKFNSSSWSISLTPSVDVLSNGSYVVRSANWNSGRGAATWGSGGSGFSGAVSSANSLVGSTADVYSITTVTNTHADGRSYDDTTYAMTTVGDHVGLLGTGLPNGAYVVASPLWNGGRGAVTWIGANGANGTGAVTGSNSLVGSNPDVYSTTPLAGSAGGDQSLAGGASLLPIYSVSLGDHLGAVIESTTYFNPVESKLHSDNDIGTTTSLPLLPSLFLNSSQSFQSSGTTQSLTGYSYSFGIRAQSQIGIPSLGIGGVGSLPPVSILSPGGGGVASLPQLNIQPLGDGGNFLVGSPGWANGSAVQAGAVTFGSAASGLPTGALSAANSLVGTHSYDRIGRNLNLSGGYGASTSSTSVTALSNGNFVVIAPGWNNSSTETSDQSSTGMGAAIWGSGTTGIAGEISSANALVGSHAGDNVGSGGVTVLSGGNYLVKSLMWANGSASAAGAVTWGNGATGVAGEISSSNSLVGTHASDWVGMGGISILSDGNYVVQSSWWANGSARSAGAVTWGSWATGVAGEISSSNSLVGTHASDQVGNFGVTVLANGAYVVHSPMWANGNASAAGAVTYGPAGGISGVVSSSNSLVGSSSSDMVGLSGIQVLTDSAGTFTNYLVKSSNWTDAATGVANVGAVTWVNGATGYVYGATPSGNRGTAVSATNSLVGNYQNDRVGSVSSAPLTVTIGGEQRNTGDGIIVSANARVGDLNGAITLVPGDAGVAGRVSWRNSIIGFNDATHNNVGWVSYKVLPYATTSQEVIKYRPLVWTTTGYSYYSDNTRLLALSVVNEQAANTAGAVGHTTESVNAGDGSDWTSNGSFLNSVGALTGYGYSNGLLAFTAGGDTSAVITPATITALLNAGTSVTLQANNDITVLKPIVSSASGHGGALTLEAGRSIHLFANVNTDGGNFTALANQSAANGVVSNSADSSNVTMAQIYMAPGVGVDAGSGDVRMELLASSDKSKAMPSYSKTYDSATSRYVTTFSTTTLTANSSGNITLGDLAGANITAENHGGANTVAGYGDVQGNSALSISFGKSGSGNGTLSFSAWRDVAFGSTSTGQSVTAGYASGASGLVNLLLTSDAGSNLEGAINLANFSANSHGGNITLSGGSGRAYAESGGSYGISILGLSALNAGTGDIHLAGANNQSAGWGVSVAGDSSANPIIVTGAHVRVEARRSNGSAGSALSLTNATLGDSSVTDTVDLLSSGYSDGSGSLELGGSVSLLGKPGATLTVAADRADVAAQFGGVSDANGGFWLAGTSASGSLAQLLASASGFAQVNLGRADQAGATSLQGMDLANWLSAAADYDLTVVGGVGGMTVSGTVSGGLASSRKFALATANGGGLALGSSQISAPLLELAAAGNGSTITQNADGSVTSAGLRLNAAAANVTLDGSANAIGAVAGSVAGGSVNNGQTLTVGSTQGVSGLASASDLILKASGSSSDLDLEQAISSAAGKLTLVAGRHFVNHVALNQGIHANQYWVYAQEPSTLSDGVTSSRGMTGYSKHYGVGYSGSAPSYAASGDWFFYAATPTLHVSATLDAQATYGTATPSPTFAFTGYIDGDDAASAGLAGAADVTTAGYTASGAGFRPAGSYQVALNGAGTLHTDLGYAFDVPAASGTLTVLPKTVEMTGSRQYDGSTNVAITDLKLPTNVLLSGDVAQTARSARAHVASGMVGDDKAVTFDDPALVGADAGNYQVTGSISITPPPSTLRSENLLTLSNPQPAPAQSQPPAPSAAPQPGTTPVSQPGTLTTFNGGVSLGGATGGSALVAMRQETSVRAVAGQAFSLPAGEVFQHSDPGAKLSFTATQANGQPLPGWMQVDAATGTVRGNPPPGVSGVVKVKLTARDANGNTAVVQVEIDLANR